MLELKQTKQLNAQTLPLNMQQVIVRGLTIKRALANLSETGYLDGSVYFDTKQSVLTSFETEGDLYAADFALTMYLESVKQKAPAFIAKAAIKAYKDLKDQRVVALTPKVQALAYDMVDNVEDCSYLHEYIALFDIMHLLPPNYI